MNRVYFLLSILLVERFSAQSMVKLVLFKGPNAGWLACKYDDNRDTVIFLSRQKHEGASWFMRPAQASAVWTVQNLWSAKFMAASEGGRVRMATFNSSSSAFFWKKEANALVSAVDGKALTVFKSNRTFFTGLAPPRPGSSQSWSFLPY